MTDYLFTYYVTPDVAVVVDDSCCIMIRTPGSFHTISNVDELTRALKLARMCVKAAERDADSRRRLGIPVPITTPEQRVALEAALTPTPEESYL